MLGTSFSKCMGYTFYFYPEELLLLAVGRLRQSWGLLRLTISRNAHYRVLSLSLDQGL
jgi:hypothetical protein